MSKESKTARKAEKGKGSETLLKDREYTEEEQKQMKDAAKQFTDMLTGGNGVDKYEYDLFKKAVTERLEGLGTEQAKLNGLNFTVVEVKNGPMDISVSTADSSFTEIMAEISNFYKFMSDEFGYSLNKENVDDIEDPNIA